MNFSFEKAEREGKRERRGMRRDTEILRNSNEKNIGYGEVGERQWRKRERERETRSKQKTKKDSAENCRSRRNGRMESP